MNQLSMGIPLDSWWNIEKQQYFYEMAIMIVKNIIQETKPAANTWLEVRALCDITQLSLHSCNYQHIWAHAHMTILQG